MKINEYTKAIVAGATAFLGTLQVAQLDNVVTSAEWTGIAGATIAALALVFGVSNDKNQVL